MSGGFLKAGIAKTKADDRAKIAETIWSRLNKVRSPELYRQIKSIRFDSHRVGEL